jgi:hypothetical protein
MRRRIVEDNAMSWIAQEGSPGLLGLQDATFALDAQIGGDIRLGSDVAHQSLRKVDIEVVSDEVPFGHAGIGLDRALDVVHKVCLISSGAIRCGANPAGGDIQVDDECLSAVPDVLILAPFHFAGSHGQARLSALQSLNATQFIGAHGPLTLASQFRRLAIQAIDVFDLFIELLIGSWRQPIADQVRLEITLFLKAAPRAEERCDLQSCAP